MQALIERATLAKLINQSQRSSLYKALSARGWRSSEPGSGELAPEAPVLTHEIGIALLNRGLDPAEVAHIVGYRRSDSPQPFVPVPTRLRSV
jgi:hypothetical protein